VIYRYEKGFNNYGKQSISASNERNHTQVKEEIKNVRQVEIPKQLEFVSLRPQKGHTFEFNYKTGEIKAAEFKIDAVNFETLRLALYRIENN
jgi:hypothetical protein